MRASALFFDGKVKRMAGGKASAADMAAEGAKFMGRAYTDMDCQAFVERCMSAVGVKYNLPGSNAWYRKMSWVGTPEECVKKFGCVPLGAFLYILEKDGGEPGQYKQDGIGNASHIGIKTGMSCAQMLDAAAHAQGLNAGELRALEKKAGGGDGAMHSSKSRGCVCTSNFKDKTVPHGGWNRVGLWFRLTYGEAVDAILDGKKPQQKEQSKTGGDAVEEWVKMEVWAASGSTVNIRKEPAAGAARETSVPIGSVVDAGPEENGWRPVRSGKVSGWMKAEYLKPVPEDTTRVTVNRRDLENIYNQLGDWLGLRG